VRRRAKAIAATTALLLLTSLLSVNLAAATPPSVALNPASSVSYTSAHLSGKVNPEDRETTYHFEYQEAAIWWMGYVSGPTQGPLLVNSGETTVEEDLTGLKSGTEYVFRLVAESPDGRTVSAEPDPTFTTLAIDSPMVSIDSPSSVTSTSAHFSGTINPEAPGGNPAVYDVEWSFECTPACPGLSGGTLPADSSSHVVEADATDLEPGTAYEVELVASNAGGRTSAGPESFATPAVPPQIISTDAAPLKTEATLKARLNPGGLATTYHFEYGPDLSYGQSTDHRTIAAGGAPVTVRAPLFGLTPGATYHFKLVAENSEGSEESGDSTFTTEGNAGDSCPNAAIRAIQGAAFLPACRAYELVSPTEPAESVVDDFATVQSDAAGDRVAFGTAGSLPGSSASAYGSYFVADRGPDGWSTTPIDLPQLNPAGQVATPTFFLSADLRRAAQFSSHALAPGAQEGAYNVYLTDTTTGERTFVGTTSDRSFMNDLVQFSAVLRRVAGTEDLSHFLFVTAAQLLPEATPSVKNVYEWTDGSLRLVNFLPDGSPASAASGIDATARNRRSMSADGSKIYFVSGNTFEEPLYLRLNGQTTIPISVSRRPGDPPTPQPARLGGISEDGEVVYFMSGAPLTSDASDGGPGGNLYRYDREADELTNLTPLSDPDDYIANVAKVSEVADDGSSVFFTSWANLTGDGVSFQPNLYAWREGDLELIGTLAEVEAGGPSSTGLSPDGRYLAFTSAQPLTGEDTSNPKCHAIEALPGACSEVYLYDSVEGELGCISCSPVDGVPAASEVGRTSYKVSEYAPQIVLDDGSVFFNSAAALSPQDVNGKTDVYEWNGERPVLISSGRAPVDSTFAEISADAGSVFFFTSQRLVRADVDADVDVYSARRDGGIPAQNRDPAERPSCAGETCQGIPPATPAIVDPGSRNVRDPGDPGAAAGLRLHARKSAIGSSFRVSVTTPGPGRLTVKGRWIRDVSRRVRAAGTYRMKVRLTAVGRQLLKRKGRIEVRLTAVYQPASGRRSAASTSIVINSGEAK